MSGGGESEAGQNNNKSEMMKLNVCEPPNSLCGLEKS